MKPARTCTIRTTRGPVGIGLLLLFVLIGLALYLAVLGLPTILYFLLTGPIGVSPSVGLAVLFMVAVQGPWALWVLSRTEFSIDA